MSVDIGIDPGTDSTLVYVKGKGVVLKEPSLVAVDLYTNEIKAAGEEALIMQERAAYGTAVARPVKKGRIPDYIAAEKMIKYFLCKCIGKKLFMRPSVAICVSCAASGADRKALEKAALSAGARDVLFIEEPVAAATGAGMDIFRDCGNMVVDIGAGVTDIAVISSGKTVMCTALEAGGGDFDEALVRYMRKKRGILIGRRTAEDVKIKIGTARPPAEERAVELTGRGLLTGIQKTASVTSAETEEAFKEPAAMVADAILLLLGNVPPHLAADIKERGIVLTGGGSLLRGLELLIEEKTGVHAVTAQEPASAAAAGIGMYAGFMEAPL